MHVRSVQRWSQAWSAGGEAGLLSKGPVSRPILSDEMFALLEQELDKGPVAHGWPDQTWTLARIVTLIGRRFHKVVYALGRGGAAAPPRLVPPGSRATRRRARR